MATSEETLIRLFKMDGKPYHLSYDWRKQYYKNDKAVLNSMIKKGTVKLLERTTKKILFEYVGV